MTQRCALYGSAKADFISYFGSVEFLLQSYRPFSYMCTQSQNVHTITLQLSTTAHTYSTNSNCETLFPRTHTCTQNRSVQPNRAVGVDANASSSWQHPDDEYVCTRVRNSTQCILAAGHHSSALYLHTHTHTHTQTHGRREPRVPAHTTVETHSMCMFYGIP